MIWWIYLEIYPSKKKKEIYKYFQRNLSSKDEIQNILMSFSNLISLRQTLAN